MRTAQPNVKKLGLFTFPLCSPFHLVVFSLQFSPLSRKDESIFTNGGSRDVDILLHIAYLHDPIPYDSHASKCDKYHMPSADIIALVSTCASIRKDLASLLWRCLTIGEIKPAMVYEKTLQHLLQCDTILENVRMVWFGSVVPSCVDISARVIAKMKRLKMYRHATNAPIPLVILETLGRLPGKLQFASFELKPRPLS